MIARPHAALGSVVGAGRIGPVEEETGVRTKRGLYVAVAIAALAAGCSSGDGKAKSGGAGGGDKGGKVKIALANSYIGNKWRIEMANVFKAAYATACATVPLRKITSHRCAHVCLSE